MDTKGRKELQAELKRQGFLIQDIGRWPAKATYYKDTGEAMHNLPADPFSMQRYLRRGFTLTPPVSPSNGEGEFKCECGFVAKSKFGLQAHKRKHERESEQGEK